MSYDSSKFQRAVTKCLSRAIVDVAEGEFVRLSKDKSPVAQAEEIREALRELLKLSSGSEMPNYENSWVPLMYLTWYHPRQVNLAYSIVLNSLRQLSTDRCRPEKLYIVDYGCGTLAMQFGIALAQLKCKIGGFATPEIRMDALDTSEPMIELGKRVWNRFIKLLPPPSIVNLISCSQTS